MNGFDDWMDRYATVFGLHYPAGLTMIAAWERVFDLDAVTLSELDAALDHLATRDVPEKMWDHLSKLQSHLRSQRSERSRIRDEGYEDHRCVYCDGTGYAVVPNLRCVHGREWRRRNGTWYTYAVTCECSRGVEIQRGCVEGATKSDRQVPLSLAEYKRRNPWFLAQLEKRDEAQAAALEATKAAQRADGDYGGMTAATLDATVARLLRRVRGREPGEEG